MKTQVVKFFRHNGLADTEHLDKPKPSKFYLPKWYKDAETYSDGNKPSFRSNGESRVANHGLKKCIPFLDGLIYGYMLETQVDIIIETNPAMGPLITWGSDPIPVTERVGNIGTTIPRPAGHYNNHFAWKLPYGFQTPNGYSTLVTHPLNRFDLPFTTLSGIMDSDQYSSGGNLPFFLKEGFEGLIPVGTPFAQLIFIKRDNWKSIMDNSIADKSEKLLWLTRRVYSGYYKLNTWKKKSFE